MLTIDVEPDWGVSGCRAVRETLPRFCKLLERHGVRATFFVVAKMLCDCADIFRKLLAGHEVASHGLSHRVLTEIDGKEVDHELAESRRRLREVLDAEVNGFRAPFLKTPQRWFAALEKAGYRYDSSWGAVSPSRRNVRPARWRTERHGNIVEIPTAAMRTGWIPFSLTYLRLLAPIGERLISPCAAVMYLHLHELADPSLARVLPMPLRMILRRGAGPKAWSLFERVLERFGHRAITCSEFVALKGTPRKQT